jgi:CheY-like chemotaxis protein
MKIAEKIVVVVDDSSEHLQLVRDVLEDGQYRVITCDDVDRALPVIREARPDLLVLDVRMPNVPDWRILDLVKLDPETMGTPTLVCSAAQPEVRKREKRLRQQGCEIVLKPFALEELLTKADRLTRSADARLAPCVT